VIRYRRRAHVDQQQFLHQLRSLHDLRKIPRWSVDVGNEQLAWVAHLSRHRELPAFQLLGLAVEQLQINSRNTACQALRGKDRALGTRAIAGDPGRMVERLRKLKAAMPDFLRMLI
jgi:hypothetical protein